ncbi:nitroreductase/quinone reductase family protein [Flavisphingomonas formosensis]|uniref:nitroreductase/quinone reductase family protein n=1 Tax=Flavisphingomonas formosensis TaxID=861534 RepID=UPI0012F9A747|nr:nitroreductase/quinone reductase family protein [Sphingomonas formosensis]
MALTAEEIQERQRFSSGGRTGWIILRGQWGLAIDRLLVRWTGFSFVTWQYAKARGGSYTPVILFTTIGRASGRRRETVLPFYVWQGKLILTGSNGGGPTDPHWTSNIRKTPLCAFRFGRRRYDAIGHVAAGEEREQILDAMAKEQPFVRAYAQETARNGRELPFVVLEPVTPLPPSPKLKTIG